jgi:hypothetical protein
MMRSSSLSLISNDLETTIPVRFPETALAKKDNNVNPSLLSPKPFLDKQIEYDMGTLHSASDFYFSAQAHKMNEIMKTLTIISVVFIPLTFIVGVYGMNFKHMPELEYEYGYYTVVGLMIFIVLAMIYYFKRRRWF